jgi:hypothetical protein
LKKHSIKYIVLAIFFIVSNINISFSQKENAKLAKFMNVKSWSASYKETYISEKTWEMSPGLTTKTSIRSTISGIYKLEKQTEDGYLSEDWYGYGKGSSVMNQTVIMSSEGLTITEHTQTLGSGSIGIPSKNEYGEFWGGYLSIDIYSGTYSFGFGGPDAESTSTFTRTVDGLPTDYSDLENLPEGMRELFIALGAKAEEWATYSGPLEDAQGINVGGLAGFELFPDMDEPENKLPENGMILQGSYSGKNITKSWTIFPTGMELPKVFLEIVDKDWIPEKENTVEVKLSWENARPSEVEFTLFDISKEPGICLNSKDDNSDPDMDITQDEQSEYFDIKKSEAQIIALKKNPDKKELTVVINSLDYGAHAKIKARINIADIWYDAEVKELGGNELHVPYDKNENHIADKWEKEVGIYEKNYDPSWDFDPFPGNQRSNGDGFTLYEEYRGFQEFGNVFRKGENEQVKDGHVRMDPNYKDVFIVDYDGLFEKFYKPYNSADLNWHIIKPSMMKRKGTPEKDPDYRWVNFNTSKKYFFRNQYAIIIVNKGKSLNPDVKDDVGYTPILPSCSKTMRYSRPLKCIYSAEIYLNTINDWANKAPGTSIDKDKFALEQVTSTISHELGHALGIAHHMPIMTLGYKKCAIRYDSDTEMDHPRLFGFLRTEYCKIGDIYITGEADMEGEFKQFRSHNCYGQINVKGN